MARKPKEPTASDDRIKLIEALAFASIAMKDADGGKSSYVAIGSQWLSAENDTLTLGIAVDIDLELCPQAAMFKAALQQCGQNFQLTQIEASALSLKSGNFRAVIPALPPELATPLDPDGPCAVIDDRLKVAFEACSKAMSKQGERVYNKSVLLRAGTMVGTNGGIAVEYWHGIDLPGPFAIPKKTVETLAKISKPLAQFGFSANSVTFYFDDNSFLKSRILSDAWPDVDRLYAHMNTPFQPIWPEFFVGLKAIDAFIQSDTVYFHAGFLATHNSLELGASYRIDGLPAGYVFSAAYWRALEPFIERVQMSENRAAPTGFVGPSTRGLIMGKVG